MAVSVHFTQQGGHVEQSHQVRHASHIPIEFSATMTLESLITWPHIPSYLPRSLSRGIAILCPHIHTRPSLKGQLPGIVHH